MDESFIVLGMKFCEFGIEILGTCLYAYSSKSAMKYYESLIE